MEQTVEKQEDETGAEAEPKKPRRKQSHYAEAGRKLRAEREKNTTVRKCLNCGSDFKSEGIHHRLCSVCRKKN